MGGAFVHYPQFGNIIDDFVKKNNWGRDRHCLQGQINYHEGTGLVPKDTTEKVEELVEKMAKEGAKYFEENDKDMSVEQAATSFMNRKVSKYSN